jgi:predicted Ser/Thr protein kinase/MFS family permease
VTETTCPTCHRPLPPEALLCPVCALLGAKDEAAPAGAPPLDEIQAAFPELEVLECIGRGGMGIVYKARQPHLDRFVALKILAPELSVDPGFAERFSREARTLAKLSHPHIVGIHDYGQRGEFCFLLMEYVDGVNLRQAMRAARFTPEQALALIPDLCAALQFAHDHGVLHRDIKPENILIDTRGRVRIADFGIAQLLSEGPSHLTLTATGSALGSAAYMAPEQIEASGEIDHRADIYSLGVVFYEMLTGGLPLGRFPLPSEKSTASAGVDDVVLRALEKERERRYQSADAVRSGLDHASAYKPAAVPTRPSDPDDQQHRITMWSLGLLGGGFIAAMVGLATSPVILGFGAVAFIFGMIGCWWLLIGMKSGRYRPVQRRLLLGIAFFPTLIGMVWLLIVIPLLRSFPGLMYSYEPWSLWWILIPFVITVVLGKLLLRLITPFPSGEHSSGPHRFKRWAPVLGIAALLLSLLAGKHLKMQLNLLANYRGSSFQLRDAKTKAILSSEDAPLVKDTAIKAAGDYAGFYRIEFPPHRLDSVSLEFTKDGYWQSEGGKKHIDAFEQRLRALLPARIAIERAGDGVHAREVNDVCEMMEISFTIAMVVFLATGALIIIFASTRASVISIVIGAVAAVALGAVPSWPAPSILPPSLGDRPPLPELPLPDENFKSPEAAVETMIKGAEINSTQTFLKAFQADELDEKTRARVLKLMPFFAVCYRSGTAEAGEAPGSVTIFTTFFSLRDPSKPRRIPEGFPLTLKLQQGEWRIIEIERYLEFLEDRASKPYFKYEK